MLLGKKARHLSCLVLICASVCLGALGFRADGRAPAAMPGAKIISAASIPAVHPTPDSMPIMESQRQEHPMVSRPQTAAVLAPESTPMTSAAGEPGESTASTGDAPAVLPDTPSAAGAGQTLPGTVHIRFRVEEFTSAGLAELGWNDSIPGNPRLISWDDVAAKIKALEEAQQAFAAGELTMDNPDGQTGTAFIGEQYPVVTTKIVGNQPIYTVESVDIGLKIEIVPNIDRDGVITASIQVEDSYVAGEVKTPGGSMPVIRTRTIKTLCRLREGQTLVLTGFSDLSHHDKDRIGCVFFDFTING
jgi:hypothetical protein